MSIHQIDFGQLYREHLLAAGGREKPPERWDARAAEMKQHMAEESSYVHDFVTRMNLDGCASLLDVGCGTGAIALALAGQMKKVYGLDYSPGMLAALREGIAERGLDHVEPIQLAWEDDWRDVPVCDVVVASRSTLVMDMADALAKLDAKARRRVYLTSMAGGRFLDVEIAELLGRAQPPLPDYIYIINLLYRMGRHPRLDYIENDNRLAGADNADDFVRKVASVAGGLSADESDRLRAWYAADPQRGQRGGSPFRWAFIGWEK